MTLSQLYALYRAGHAEARRISEGGVLRAFEVSVNGIGIGALERLVLEFALHDATNGTPVRTPEGFVRAVEQAPELFARLGLRPDDGTATGGPSGTRLRDAA